MPDKKTRVVIADDHQILLDGLTALLNAQDNVLVAGTYDNGHDLMEAIPLTRPDIAIVDVSMPSPGGAELTRSIREHHPGIAVIALSMHDDNDHIMDMIEAGVSAYVLKNANDRQLLEAIRNVSGGKMFFSPEVSAKIALLVRKQQEQSREMPVLTTREKEIIRLIVKECSNAEIAAKLFISERTVETHRKNMMRKLNTKTIIGLVKYAIDNQLA